MDLDGRGRRRSVFHRRGALVVGPETADAIGHDRRAERARRHRRQFPQENDRVDALCNDLANVLRADMVFAPFATGQSQSQGSGQGWNQNHQAQSNYQGQGAGGGDVSLFVPGSGGPWGGNLWPAELGNPSSTGAQNNLSYAVFPATRRLAIQNNGQMTVYTSVTRISAASPNSRAATSRSPSPASMV